MTDYYYLNVIVIAIFKKNANLDEKKKTMDQKPNAVSKQSTSATPIYITKKMTQREFMGHIIVV